jgi:hypothetical protein
MHPVSRLNSTDTNILFAKPTTREWGRIKGVKELDTCSARDQQPKSIYPKIRGKYAARKYGNLLAYRRRVISCF